MTLYYLYLVFTRDEPSTDKLNLEIQRLNAWEGGWGVGNMRERNDGGLDTKTRGRTTHGKDIKGIYHPSPVDWVPQAEREETDTEKRKDQEEIPSGLYQIGHRLEWEESAFFSFCMQTRKGNAGGGGVCAVKRRCASPRVTRHMLQQLHSACSVFP